MRNLRPILIPGAIIDAPEIMDALCNRCGYARPVPREQPSGEQSDPSLGDFWLCPMCGQLHRWFITVDVVGIRLVVREAYDQELEELAPELRADLREVRSRILRGQTFGGRQP